MSTHFAPLEIPAGVVALATKNQRSSNWSEVNLMRWLEGHLLPIGGQAQYSYSFASRCRAIHGWYGLDQIYRIAYLCESNLYVDVGGVLTDISPTPGIVPPVAATTGGYSDGDYSAGTYGTARSGSTILALDRVPDAFSLDNFGSILYAMTSPDGRLLMWNPAAGPPAVGVTLAATAAFVTTSPNITMVANPGTVKPGQNVYDVTNSQWIGSVLTYTGTTLVLGANAAHASAGAADQLTFSNIAVAQPGAPYGRCFVVTPERFIQIFGMIRDGTVDGGSPRRFGWCDQENPGHWDFSNVTSQAGFLDIEPASPIVTAISTRNGTLFWTGKKAYLSRFLGIPYVYNYEELAANCTPWSPESMVSTSLMTLWMSQQGVFSFDGTSILPVACNVRAWVDEDIDLLSVREQACAVHVGNFNEFWWFFPQDGEEYNTRCIIYNYKEGWWSMGRMPRSAGVTASFTGHTIMADGTVAYQHEAGAVYPANVPLPWAETFDLNLNSGGFLTTLKQLMPDVEGDIGNLRYSLFYRMSRSLGDPELQTPPKSVRGDGYVDLRTTGRDIRLRIQLAGPEVNPVSVGQHLVDAVHRGDR